METDDSQKAKFVSDLKGVLEENQLFECWTISKS